MNKLTIAYATAMMTLMANATISVTTNRMGSLRASEYVVTGITATDELNTNAVKRIVEEYNYVQTLEPSTNYTDTATNAIAAIIPTASTFADEFAIKATETTVSQWEDYWTGDRVRLSVTNYYGNTTGEPPRLRIEELDHKTTNVVDGVEVVSNVYRIVWDEVTRQTNYYTAIDAKIDGISNATMIAAYQQTYNQLAGKAPRAWGTVTSTGESSPEGIVWMTQPNTVFAGGTVYSHVAVGEGTICVLTDNGAPVYSEGEEGQFRFKDDSGDNYFGFDVRESYTIGCRTDGIEVSTVGGENLVSLTYDLSAANNPDILHCTNLLTGAWTTLAAGSEVVWDVNPPAGTKICHINAGANPEGFYKAQMTYAGGSKFVTNMMADLAGGIAATNEAGIGTASELPIYPVITATGVVWRVRQ